MAQIDVHGRGGDVNQTIRINGLNKDSLFSPGDIKKLMQRLSGDVIADWVDYKEMQRRGVHAYDSKNRQVRRVRAAYAADGGVVVRVLIPVGDGSFAIHDHNDVVEAEVFISGGRLAAK